MNSKNTERKQGCTFFQTAAASGDMRRALEACTAALELKVQEAVAEQADLTANAIVGGNTVCYAFSPAASVVLIAMLAACLLLR